MEFVIDTHALHWFLLNSKQLTRTAKNAIVSATQVYIPSIVLLEAFFVSKKSNKIDIFKDFLDTIPNEKFSVAPLTIELVKECVELDPNLEIHDLIIVASAKLLDLSIITKDEEITKAFKKVVW